MKLFLLILLVSLGTFSTNLYVPALPKMVPLFHTNIISIQQSLVSFTYGFAVCMLFSGVLADSIGRKKTLLMGIFIYIFASLSILFCHHLSLLIFLRFLQGVGGCCGTVVARVIVRDQCEDQKAVGVLALLSSGMAIAFILGPLIGSFLVNFFSWRACFVLLFLIGIGIFLLLALFLPETKPKISSPQKITLSFIFSQYVRALQSKNFVVHTAMISICWTGFFLIMMEYPFIIMNQLKYSIVNFGLTFSIMLAAYLMGSRIANLLSRLTISSDTAVMYGLMVMSFAGIIALAVSHHVNEVVLIVAGFVYLLGMGIQIPNSQFAAIPPEEKGSAIVTSLLYFIEMFLVAGLSNYFKSHFSTSPTVLWSVILIFILMSLFILMCFISSGGSTSASACKVRLER